VAAKAQGWAVDRALARAAAWVADADEERVPEMGAVEVAAAEVAAAVAVRAGRNRSQPIRITIASGKGGTGKTTIAVNLAYVLAQQGEAVHLVDCDVEEPNAHIFLKPQLEGLRPVSIPTPEVDAALCTGCGECGEMCQYGAIVVVMKKVLTFPALCNGCGGCMLVCPEKAITEVPREIGVIEEGTAGRMRFTHGVLNVGEARATPIIRELTRNPAGKTVILDAPPGTSCPVVESVRSADYVVLVTEPTPFGLNDLELAVGMVRELEKPFAVVINRADTGDDSVGDYCTEQDIPVPLEIPDSREIAEAYSRGELIAESVQGYGEGLMKLHEFISRELKE
jgi:MinD superfamily P-loop ATPase